MASSLATAQAGYGHLQNCFCPDTNLVVPVGVKNPLVLYMCCRIIPFGSASAEFLNADIMLKGKVGELRYLLSARFSLPILPAIFSH